MKTYKKVLIAIGAVILDFLISYFGLRLLIYLGIAQERFVSATTNDLIATMAALMVTVPLALSAVALVVLVLVRIIHSVYIHIRYGLKHTDQDDHL